nr:MAG TPA: hypothetical protein [Caudoviricetes sp.]
MEYSRKSLWFGDILHQTYDPQWIDECKYNGRSSAQNKERHSSKLARAIYF